jgi:MYXO-CTERM domain-containing protein
MKLGAKVTSLFALVVFAAVFLVSSDALAAGRFTLKSSEMQEQSGAWHVFVTIELSKPPPIPHQTMRFLFTKTAVYERSLVDNRDTPVTNVTVLQNQSPSVESLDVDFSNASGKIFNITRFDFGITRDRGYEAGEYSVQLRTSDGIEIGGRATIKLKGDNPVVDRRAMNFNAKDSKIKKIDGVDAGAKQVAQNDENPNNAGGGNGEVTATGTAQPFIPADAYNKTPEENIQVKPKSGCGCSVPGMSSTENALFALLPLSAIALAVARRRQRGRTQSDQRERRVQQG